jgi:nucleoid-associated protein YgaU
MDQLEQLKSKYATALETIREQGVRVTNLHVQDGKLIIRGAAPSERAKNDVWTAIKSVDATYRDLAADISIDSSLPSPAPAPARTYTVKSGDTLSKISREFYGDANQYQKIFQANRDQLSDPDKIRPGQVLRLP